MTALDRRDRRRAAAVVIAAGKVTTSPLFHPANLEPLIAAALKQERDETGMGAINWFLFSTRETTAKAKRAIAQKYCTRKHCSGWNCSKPRRTAEAKHGKAKP